MNVGKVVKLPDFLCTTLDSLCRHPELTTHCSQLKMTTADGKEDNPKLVSRTNRFKLIAPILVGIAGSRKQPPEVWERFPNGTSWYLKASREGFIVPFIVPNADSRGTIFSVLAQRAPPCLIGQGEA